MDNQFLDEGLLFKPAEPVELELASQGKRFGTYIIDSILSYIVIIGIMIVYVLINPNGLGSLEDDSSSSQLTQYLLIYVSIILYYAFFEIVCKGRTLGKMICGTRALTSEGAIMDGGTAFKRTLCRIVPFDPLSFLGGNGMRGWHDRWSDTMVVEEKSYQGSLR